MFWRLFEKAQCYFIVFIMTPAYFMFMMTLVRQTLVNLWNMGPAKHAFHIILSTYCFINVGGNMLMSILVDTSLDKTTSDQCKAIDYCEKCKMLRPRKSWHCRKCNVCILRRDHHCYILSSCIGLYNQRYYVLYLFHLAFSMLYSTFYSYYFVTAKFEEHGFVLSLFRIINPLLRHYLNEPWSVRDLYVFFVFMNTGLIIWSVGLFMFHFKNVMKGATAHEWRNEELKLFHPKWKENVVGVFGERWYLAIFWPFVESPLPESEAGGMRPKVD